MAFDHNLLFVKTFKEITHHIHVKNFIIFKTNTPRNANLVKFRSREFNRFGYYQLSAVSRCAFVNIDDTNVGFIGRQVHLFAIDETKDEQRASVQKAERALCVFCLNRYF